LNTYSLSEKPIGKWIDGRTLYRKGVAITTPAVGATQDFPINVSNLKTFVRLYGGVHNSSTDFWIPVIYAWLDGNCIGAFYRGANTTAGLANSISVKTMGSNQANCAGYVFIEYTKTV